MRFEGTVQVTAPRAKVWEFVTDPTKVGQCGPGVEAVEMIDPTHFVAKAKVGIGAFSARFAADGEVIVPIRDQVVEIKVRGQAPGSAVDADAIMTVSEVEDGITAMAWTAEVTISGKLASIGARLIEGTANRLIAQTFVSMKAALERPGTRSPYTGSQTAPTITNR